MADFCQTPSSLVHTSSGEPRDAHGNRYLAIDDARDLPPFLMSLVSDDDLWMYVSSGHALTCGRGQAERCLFPYETDDRLHRAGGQVGPFTALRVARAGHAPVLWCPFAPDRTGTTQLRLYKSELGDRLVFEATHPGLGLAFRYRWASASRFGFVRTAELALSDSASAACEVEVLDGLLSIMPAGVELPTQQRASALVNAYRRSERLVENPRMAVYALSAKIVDRAEPAEALRANVVWSVGLEGASLSLDGEQIERFMRGLPLEATREHRGRPGAYLLGGQVSLEPGASTSWHLVADVDRSQAEVVALLLAAAKDDVVSTIARAIEDDARSLSRKLAAADAIQQTGDRTQDAHHLANVLFNCLRGGLFIDDYRAPSRDVRAFIEARNRHTAKAHAALFARLPESVDCLALLDDARRTGDKDLVRLVLEYLPVTFSRRHGDPSRPWNTFNIRVRHRDGSPNLYYEGNWRDIFQNWEALLLSFPGFLPHVVAKFVNASTVDGFNPYRITRAGIDWEVPEPDDPWSYIGYWGDHQIVYLTRLLEALEAHWPGAIDGWLREAVFTYADVPYRLASHERTVENPRDTVSWDEARAEAVAARVATMGADGRLLPARGAPGRVHHVTLAEKLVVPVLAKLGQLVLEGGIWMNTQRPEWNDANNALAGYGLSMVTLCQLRRHLALLERVFSRGGDTTTTLSAEVAAWLDRVVAILESVDVTKPASDQTRRVVLDQLGRAAAAYRAHVYDHGLGAGVARPLDALAALCKVALPVLDRSIAANRREDGLYNAYSLLRIRTDGDDATVEPMVEMLEGQVAVLGAGVLGPDEAADVLDALFESALFRDDQQSFLLYPDRDLPGFLEKNVVPAAAIADDPLLRRVLEHQETRIAERDARGDVRFCADFRNAVDLGRALDALASDDAWSQAIADGRERLLDTFEQTFHHHAFTGRSGTMFAYEGLGSIYWHMVSKLLLAVQENLRLAIEAGADEASCVRLLAHYQRVKSGLGPAKSPRTFGAFPTDPYSHTPRHAGAQQPGMTGQVKEEILTRRGELGVVVERGCLRFGLGTLLPSDFISGDDAGSLLSFTVAGLRVRYRLVLGGSASMVLETDHGPQAFAGLTLDEATSRRVFLRDRTLRELVVTLPG